MIENKPLKSLNSFGLEAFARYFYEFAELEQLRAFFAPLRPDIYSSPWALLGGGNNILLTENYSGTMLHPISRGIEVLGYDARRVRVRVAAGEEWDDFVAWAVGQGYGGVENLSLIPGYVGAAPIQNIGAYGVEVKNVIREVELYMPECDEVVRLPRGACQFAYRDSIFKHELKGRAIVLSVTFELTKGPRFQLDYGDLRSHVEQLGAPTLQRVRESVIEIRRDKLPDPLELGNAGSFFKNPIVTQARAKELAAQYPEIPLYAMDKHQIKLAAGWLIDRAGWRGVRRGNVGVHERQALVLVNYGKATGREILELSRSIQEDILQRFGVKIEPEVNVL